MPGHQMQNHLPHVLIHTYGGRRLRAKAVAKGKVDAARIVEQMKKSGQVEFADERAAMAIQALTEMVITKVPGCDPKGCRPDHYEFNEKIRFNAASKILEYTQVKPVTKTENVIKTTEEWLLQIGDDAE